MPLQFLADLFEWRTGPVGNVYDALLGIKKWLDEIRDMRSQLKGNFYNAIPIRVKEVSRRDIQPSDRHRHPRFQDVAVSVGNDQ